MSKAREVAFVRCADWVAETAQGRDTAERDALPRDKQFENRLPGLSPFRVQ
jgi:hypothetical protein